MLETIGTIAGVAAIIIPVWIVMWLIGRVLAGAEERQTNAKRYEAKISMAQWARANELQGLLFQIKVAPEDQRAELWGRYLQLEVQDKAETHMERQALVNMETVIDDRTQAELDAGINPYVTEKQPRVVVSTKRARLDWE